MPVVPSLPTVPSVPVEPDAGLAPWITAEDLCCDLTGISDAVVTRACAASTEVLWALSGRRIGYWTLTLRPPPPEPDGRGLWPNYLTAASPVLFNGTVPWSVPGSSAWRMLPRPPKVVELPGPVVEVTDVTVAGESLAADAYRVDDWHLLVRVDGGVWPTCIHPEDGADAFSVTLTRGRAVPQMGVLATAELACELALACAGSECNLPQRVSTLVRKDVTMTMLDPMEFLDKGRTGLTTVDLWLASVNPSGLRRRARVSSVEQVRDHRRIGT